MKTKVGLKRQPEEIPCLKYVVKTLSRRHTNHGGNGVISGQRTEHKYFINMFIVDASIAFYTYKLSSRKSVRLSSLGDELTPEAQTLSSIVTNINIGDHFTQNSRRFD